MEQLQTKCSICDREYTQRKNLYVHLRNAHKIEPLKPKLLQPAFQCGNCGKKFLYQSSLTRHLKILHSSDNETNDNCLRALTKRIRLICPEDGCGERFSNNVNLRQHLKERHDVNIEFEDLTFNSIADFEIWRKTVEDETRSLYTLDTGVRPLLNGTSKKTYNCHRSYTYKSKGKNIRALTTVTNKIGRACPARIEVTFQNDEQSTISVKFWKTHWGHTERIERVTSKELSDGRIECGICKMIFFMRHHFETHLCNGKAKKPKKIPCPDCQKTFSSRFNMIRHSHFHSNEKPFECRACNKQFPHKYDIARHLLTHTADKPFKCNVCNRSYLQADTLKKHMQTHSCEKPFTCDQCGKTFTRKHSVFVHVKCVHKNDSRDSEKCHICNKKFKHKFELVEHMKAHTKVECDDYVGVSESKNICHKRLNNADRSLTEKTVELVVNVKEEETFTAVNEPLMKYEMKPVELSDTIVPKHEPKEEYFEIG